MNGAYIAAIVFAVLTVVFMIWGFIEGGDGRFAVLFSTCGILTLFCLLCGAVHQIEHDQRAKIHQLEQNRSATEKQLFELKCRSQGGYVTRGLCLLHGSKVLIIK